MMKLLEGSGLSKAFVAHLRGGAVINAFRDVSFSLERNGFLCVTGGSGCGKSTLLKCVYRNYDPDEGSILLYGGDNGVLDLATIDDIDMLAVRRNRLSYVSQFFRAIPRVPAIEIAAEPLRDRGVPAEEARDIASRFLERFGLPRRLWNAFPSTFSGGEKQRLNIIRSVIPRPEILLLDEPTASLDERNRGIVIDTLRELKSAGTSFIGVFHDLREVSNLVDETLELDRPAVAGLRRAACVP